MRSLSLCFFLFVVAGAYAQTWHGLFYRDTIKSTYRTGGELDSVDVSFGTQSATISGGGWDFRNNFITPKAFYQFKNGQRFYEYSDWNVMRTSGIPHVGFSYVFGSQGTQSVLAQYQQVFRKKVLLNIDYTKNRSTNFLRNNNYNHNDIQLQLLRKGNIYSFDIKSSYQLSDVEQNGGLLFDSLADQFDLIFLPVKKDVAQSKISRTRVELSNYLNFSGDSIRQFGFMTDHQLKIKKYLYLEENDTLSSIYNQINIDSNLTYDQHQWSQVGNGAGIFLLNNKSFLSATYNLDFWNFQNLGKYYDTLEHNLIAKYQLFLNRNLKLNDHFEFNIVGARQGWRNDLTVFSMIRTIRLHAKLLIDNKLPEVYQRNLVGNNFSYSLSNPQRQFRQYSSIKLEKYFEWIDLKLEYEQSYVKQNYFLIDNIWKNDSVNNLSFNTFTIETPIKWRALNFQPRYSYSVCSSGFKFIPQHQFSCRLFVKGGLFAAKKLKAYTGFDFQMSSKVKVVGFNPLFSTFDYFGSYSENIPSNNLHWFAGFQIDDFKFFTRVENIGYFWSDRNNVIYSGFPPASLQFRLGITWDFFN